MQHFISVHPYSGSNPADVLGCVQELRARVLHGKYLVPFHMSTDCANLITKLLVVNPTSRDSLEVRSIFH